MEPCDVGPTAQLLSEACEASGYVTCRPLKHHSHVKQQRSAVQTASAPCSVSSPQTTRSRLRNRVLARRRPRGRPVNQLILSAAPSSGFISIKPQRTLPEAARAARAAAT